MPQFLVSKKYCTSRANAARLQRAIDVVEEALYRYLPVMMAEIGEEAFLVLLQFDHKGEGRPAYATVRVFSIEKRAIAGYHIYKDGRVPVDDDGIEITPGISMRHGAGTWKRRVLKTVGLKTVGRDRPAALHEETNDEGNGA
ncbi:hypothetical protein HGRIS_000539 [Hohenbuehelia grisea]|uniref:Uncharacterized protein n=1 Tax=Hohenbuehelia grisea TaxID=104357 RepID=A0ABR3JRB3_9AGAR